MEYTLKINEFNLKISYVKLFSKDMDYSGEKNKIVFSNHTYKTNNTEIIFDFFEILFPPLGYSRLLLL